MTTQSAPKVPQAKPATWVSNTAHQVYFPKRNGIPAKRRFFATKEAAEAEIEAWLKGRKPDAVLGKRRVEDILYLESLLPAGVTLKDAVRFYLDHSSGASDVTVEVVCNAYRRDLKNNNRAEDYVAEQHRLMDHFAAHFGNTTLFSELTKARLVDYIKAGGSYWVRYGRKRIVSVLISRAREVDALRLDPLDGFTFEDAPKKTPHFLKLWEAEAILNYASRHSPHLVAPFALQLFAGIRTEELCRNKTATKRPLWWSDLTFGEKITVPVEVSKTNDRRIIDYWPAALTHWIVNPQTSDTPVCSVSELDSCKSHLIQRMNKERVSLDLPKVDFKQNDFRRTYATNSAAVFGGEKTKDRMGHQEHSKVLKKNYDGLTEKALAEEFFASKPERLISTQVNQEGLHAAA